MKMIKLVLVGLMVGGLALSVQAGEAALSTDKEASKHKCYMEDQRNTEFCQRVMFPPVPFR